MDTIEQEKFEKGGGGRPGLKERDSGRQTGKKEGS